MSRRGSLRRRLTTVLVGVGMVSVILLAGVTYVVAQALLENRTESSLTIVRDDRRMAVERGLGEVRSVASGLAADPGVATAFADLERAWPSLRSRLTPTERGDLEAVLTDVAVPGGPAEEARAGDLVSESVAGQRAQYLYIAQNPNPPTQRAELDDAGDGSDYSAAHARHHPQLRALLDSLVGTDLLFVASGTGDVVYSVSKRADFGANLQDGPLQDGALASAVRALPQLPVGSAVVVDTTAHAPAGAEPILFVASGVRSGSEILGALVLAVPIEGLTDLVTAGGQWERLGLGDTGQAYVVGGDGTLRTEPRSWLRDPVDHLDRLAGAGGPDADTADRVEQTGSPVLAQTVTTPATEAAAAGDDFLGAVTSPLGDRTLAAATPLDIPGLDWSLVVEQSTSETSAPVGQFLRRLGLVLAILLPIIVVIGWLVARTLVRPMQPVLGAAADIAAGDLDIDIPDLGRNELGDLAHQLEAVAADLRQRRLAIVAEDRRIEDLLGAVVPPRLMDQVRAGERGVPDLLDQATVVIVSLVDLPDVTGSDQDTILAFTDRVGNDLQRLAAEHGVEPVKVTSDHELFLAGHGHPGTRAEQAARFAVEVAAAVARTSETFGIDVSTRVGMAAGQVGTGLLGSTQASFGVWGDPPGVAATLEGLALPGEILVDAGVAADLGSSWDLVPVEGAVGLDDGAIEAFVLITGT